MNNAPSARVGNILVSLNSKFLKKFVPKIIFSIRMTYIHICDLNSKVWAPFHLWENQF